MQGIGYKNIAVKALALPVFIGHDKDIYGHGYDHHYQAYSVYLRRPVAVQALYALAKKIETYKKELEDNYKKLERLEEEKNKIIGGRDNTPSFLDKPLSQKIDEIRMVERRIAFLEEEIETPLEEQDPELMLFSH